MIIWYVKKNHCLFLLCFLLIGFQKIYSQEVTRKDEHNRIEQSIRNSIAWAGNKDFNLLYSVISNDTDYLEVNPGNRIVKGFQEFRKAEKFWADSAFKAIRYEIRDLQIGISPSGDAAWFFCMLDDINEWKGQPANWENTRWTGVLLKRKGNWQIVQSHFSFALEK